MKAKIDFKKPFKHLSKAGENLSYLGTVAEKGEFCHIVLVGRINRPERSNDYGEILVGGQRKRVFEQIVPAVTKKEARAAPPELDGLADNLAEALKELGKLKLLIVKQQEHHDKELKILGANFKKALEDNSSTVLLAVDELTRSNKDLVSAIQAAMKAPVAETAAALRVVAKPEAPRRN